MNQLYICMLYNVYPGVMFLGQSIRVNNKEWEPWVPWREEIFLLDFELFRPKTVGLQVKGM